MSLKPQTKKQKAAMANSDSEESYDSELEAEMQALESMKNGNDNNKLENSNDISTKSMNLIILLKEKKVSRDN